MKIEVGGKYTAKFLNRLDYGRIADVTVKEIIEVKSEPKFFGGRRIGTPLHPDGLLFILDENYPDGTPKPSASYHQRHLRLAPLGTEDFWCIRKENVDLRKLTHLLIPKIYFQKETDLAYCFKFETEDEGKFRFVNLPKSRILTFEMETDNCEIWIEDWLVETNQLQKFIDTSDEPGLFDE